MRSRPPGTPAAARANRLEADSPGQPHAALTIDDEHREQSRGHQEEYLGLRCDTHVNDVLLHSPSPAARVDVRYDTPAGVVDVGRGPVREGGIDLVEPVLAGSIRRAEDPVAGRHRRPDGIVDTR